MRQYPKDIPRHPARREYIQKFHRLHLEPEIAINHQQHYIGDLGDIDHAGEGIRGTF